MGYTSIIRGRAAEAMEMREVYETLKNEFSYLELIHLEHTAPKYGKFEVYAACKNRKDQIFGMVVLVENITYEFTYKEMIEEMGPYYYEASSKLISKLSPTKNAHAIEWRAKCTEHARRHEKKERPPHPQQLALI